MARSQALRQSSRCLRAKIQRFNAKSSKEGFSLAFADLPAPSAGNASGSYSATATISSGAALTGQAVMLRAAAQSAHPNPDGDRYHHRDSDCRTNHDIDGGFDADCYEYYCATPTAVATPANVTFVGTGALADFSTAVTTVTVGLPSGVQSGDFLLAQIIVYDGSASDVPVTPSGWTAFGMIAPTTATK